MANAFENGNIEIATKKFEELFNIIKNNISKIDITNFR